VLVLLPLTLIEALDYALQRFEDASN
jgi:hypothetical protein